MRRRWRRSFGERDASGSAGAASSAAAFSGAPSFFSSSSAIDDLGGGGHGRVEATLAGHGQRPRELALGVPQAGGVLELSGGVLEAQAEQVAPRCRDVL